MVPSVDYHWHWPVIGYVAAAIIVGLLSICLMLIGLGSGEDRIFYRLLVPSVGLMIVAGVCVWKALTTI